MSTAQSVVACHGGRTSERWGRSPGRVRPSRPALREGGGRGGHVGGQQLQVRGHRLSYGDTLSGQSGAWLVRKLCFICMQSNKFTKGSHIKIQYDFQNRFCFSVTTFMDRVL